MTFNVILTFKIIFVIKTFTHSLVAIVYSFKIKKNQSNNSSKKIEVKLLTLIIFLNIYQWQVPLLKKKLLFCFKKPYLQKCFVKVEILVSWFVVFNKAVIILYNKVVLLFHKKLIKTMLV